MTHLERPTLVEREMAAILAHGIDPAPEPDGLVLTVLFAAFLSTAAVGVVAGFVIGRMTDMSQFVRLTRWDKQVVWINPDHILGIDASVHYEHGRPAETRTRISFALASPAAGGLLYPMETFLGTPEQNVALLMAPPASPSLADIGRSLARDMDSTEQQR